MDQAQGIMQFKACYFFLEKKKREKKKIYGYWF